MGAPKRNGRKYERPKDIWNAQRISTDNALIEKYGLKNMSELWKAQFEVSRIRRNVRTLLSGVPHADTLQQDIMSRLERLGIIQSGATLDSLLDLNENALLERRLETVVFKKGLARTPKQARQIIVHGFIAIDGKRVNKPGYLVNAEQEPHIGYYKPIDISVKEEKAEPVLAADMPAGEVKVEGKAEEKVEEKAAGAEGAAAEEK